MPFASLCFCPVLPEYLIAAHDSLCRAEADNLYVVHTCRLQNAVDSM